MFIILKSLNISWKGLKGILSYVDLKIFILHVCTTTHIVFCSLQSDERLGQHQVNISHEYLPFYVFVAVYLFISYLALYGF